MEINLGEVQESTKVKTSKEFKPKKGVNYIEPSCGCMTVNYDSKRKRIYLTFTTGVIDMRALQTQGYQEIYKYLTVKYQDGTSERINITGKIVKKNGTE